MDKKDVQDAFLKEAGSLIHKIEKGLSRLNSNSRSAIYDSQILRLFRYAHTLKGISGTCGYYEMEEAAKLIEEIFGAAKDGKHEMSPKDRLSIKKSLYVCDTLLTQAR
jgi:chemotaxis protein histidine kinase CheA